MQVNININTATDLKITMKKHEFVVEVQSTQELEPKRKRETKVVNINRISWKWFVNWIMKTIFHCNKFLTFHVFLWPFHSVYTNKLISIRILCVLVAWEHCFNLIINTFGDYCTKKSTNNRVYSMHSFYTALLDVKHSPYIIINSCKYCMRGGVEWQLQNKAKPSAVFDMRLHSKYCIFHTVL